METRHGKASAPSAGESESERVQLEPSDRTQGEHTADNSHTDSREHLDLNIFVSCNVTDMTSPWKQQTIETFSPLLITWTDAGGHICMDALLK